MPAFAYTVVITADTEEQAHRVLVERLEFDGDHGFVYDIHYERKRDDHNDQEEKGTTNNDRQM
jgi:hypothetical protein